jgi:hypothetical protein
MALEDLEGKWSFSECFGGICGMFEWLEALVRKNKGSCIVWEFLVDFCSL